MAVADQPFGLIDDHIAQRLHILRLSGLAFQLQEGGKSAALNGRVSRPAQGRNGPGGGGFAHRALSGASQKTAVPLMPAVSRSPVSSRSAKTGTVWLAGSIRAPSARTAPARTAPVS